MVVSLRHSFVSPKIDGPDVTLVQPSNWNDEHVLTQATARLLGRTSSGTGPTEEISAGSGLTLSGLSLAVDGATVLLNSDTTVVRTTGDQTIGGIKTFSSDPRISSTEINVGNATAGEKRLRLQNSVRDVYLFNNTSSEVGLYDQTALLTRWNTDTSGNFTATGNITAFSDARLKTDLEPITSALEKVGRLTGYTYTRIDTGERQTGVIAQDVEQVLPEAVLGGEHLAVAYGNMVGLLVEAIKELTARVEALEAR